MDASLCVHQSRIFRVSTADVHVTSFLFQTLLALLPRAAWHRGLLAMWDCAALQVGSLASFTLLSCLPWQLPDFHTYTCAALLGITILY
jgi:hypothetical protein